MNNRTFKVFMVFALPLGCFLAFSQLLAEQNKGTEKQAESKDSFMYQKLEAVNKINEGLAIEDFALIKQGGEQLLTLSEDAAWKVRRDPMYMHYSTAFQSNVNGLVKAADQESLGDATLSYINITVSCMSCHKHVRGVVQVSEAGNVNGMQRAIR